MAASALVIWPTGCSNTADEAFERSRREIRGGMTLGEAFDPALAEYLVRASPKNVAGATLAAHRPASAACTRFVLDIFHSSEFRVRVYCERNAPQSRKVVPDQSFANARQLRRALDGYYRPFAANMEFRIESPPRRAFGVFDHFVLRTGADGRIDYASEIVRVPRGGAREDAPGVVGEKEMIR